MAFVFYTLDDKKRVIRCDGETWKESNKKLRKDSLHEVAATISGEMMVATIFTGLTQIIEPKPLVFVSTVFGLPDETPSQKYSTWEEAEIGHKELVDKYLPVNEEITLNAMEHCEVCSNTQDQCLC